MRRGVRSKVRSWSNSPHRPAYRNNVESPVKSEGYATEIASSGQQVRSGEYLGRAGTHRFCRARRLSVCGASASQGFLGTLWTRPEIRDYDASKESKTRAASLAPLWGVSRELGRHQPGPVQERRVKFGIAVSPWTSLPTI